MRQSDNRLALEAALSWLAVFGIHVSRYRRPPSATRPGTACATASAITRRAILLCCRG
ncbi:Uncharacterised protein [Leclercia adecarboxylata]|uniref:Uncharacterized protein n=1 Tax=Leclercia adecarboxylata TaxID=83655 RepID=A0A4U9HJJ1_9ENTR|nr:Uncharacterised protein [Leclercia adecarboxylata]